MTIADLKAVVSSDTNIQTNVQAFQFNGQYLRDDSKTLETVGVREGDMVSMVVRQSQANTGARAPGRGQARATQGVRTQSTRGSGQRPQQPRNDAEIIRLQALGDPRILEQLRQYKPEMAEAVQDAQRFKEVFDGMSRQQDAAERGREEAIERLNADPLDVEAQAKIEEMIREAAVMENLQSAMDHTPEGEIDRWPKPALQRDF